MNLELLKTHAKWITPEETTVTPGKKKKAAEIPHLPAGIVKKEFTLETLPDEAELLITAHGIYEAEMNGSRVKAAVLMPGPSTCDKRLKVQSYDVTDLLRHGENEITVTLGDGWYRSCTGVAGDRFLYGTDLSVLAALVSDGTVIVATDGSWTASTSGPVRMNDLQQGETYDARMEEVTDWHPAREEEYGEGTFSPEVLTADDGPEICEHENFPGRVFTAPNGEKVIDFGQNLAGYISFACEAREGDVIELVCGETLDQDGNFTNANFQPGKRHAEGGIRQTLTYICREGANSYKPRFTIMGFRYAKVTAPEQVLANAVFTAHAVYSRMAETAEFTSSNPLLDRLFLNSKWSMKGNFCGVPTDCPTRERAAWTGDAGVFVRTGLRLMDSYAIFENFLAECRLNQYPDGRIANIAPPNGKPSFFTGLLAGSVGWGDACIEIPLALYEYSGDRMVLRDNYEMMQRWYAYLLRRAAKRPVKKLLSRNPYEKYTIDTGFDYGEWAEPDAGLSTVEHGNGSTAMAYLFRSGKNLAKIASILGKEKDAAAYAHHAKMARRAYLRAFTQKGKITSDRMKEYVRPLAFGILEKDSAKQAAADLAALVSANDFHLNTGFLSTPYLCKVLADYGYVETAYRLLLQETAPSWLYEVKKGATTVWERWEGIAGDGTVTDSLNHYSYGAICGWMLSDVCGIDYRFDRIRIAPKPCRLLPEAKASLVTPVGRITAGYRYEDSGLVIFAEIPEGASVNVLLPDGRTETAGAGKREWRVKPGD